MRHIYQEVQHLQEEPFQACPFQSLMILMALSLFVLLYRNALHRKWVTTDGNNHLVLKNGKAPEWGRSQPQRGTPFCLRPLSPTPGHKTTKGKFNTFHRFTKTRECIHSHSCWWNALINWSINFYLCYVCLSACMYVYHMCVYPQSPGEYIGAPGPGVIKGCEPPCGC